MKVEEIEKDNVVVKMSKDEDDMILLAEAIFQVCEQSFANGGDGLFPLLYGVEKFVKSHFSNEQIRKHLCEEKEHKGLSLTVPVNLSKIKS